MTSGVCVMCSRVTVITLDYTTLFTTLGWFSTLNCAVGLVFIRKKKNKDQMRFAPRDNNITTILITIVIEKL